MDYSQVFPHGRTTAARPDRSHSLAASGYTSWDAISESLLRARADARAPSARSVRSQQTQDSRHGLQNAHLRGPASESGTSLASSGTVSSRYSSSPVSSRHAHGRSEDHDARQKSERSRTSDSAFRRGARFLQKSEALRPYALVLTLLGIVLVKWCVGLGGYSGKLCPALFPCRKECQVSDPPWSELTGRLASPMRGDLEAQRHWIALTSSWLNGSTFLHLPPSPTTRLDPRQWYFYDLSYWGLDYPPLTAYHSLFLGFCARLSRSTARFVTLRPPATSSVTALRAWDEYMSALEIEGSLKLWMRASVVVGDAMVYLSAVVRYCTRNCRAQAGDDRSGYGRYRVRIERRMVRPRSFRMRNLSWR